MEDKIAPLLDKKTKTLLKKIKLEDEQTNIDKLQGIKEELLKDYLKGNNNNNKDDYIKNLYVPSNNSKESFLSQYQSIVKQIDNITTNKDNVFKNIMENYKPNPEYHSSEYHRSKKYLKNLTKEMIFDISDFFYKFLRKECPYIGGKRFRNNYIESISFFWAAKHAPFHHDPLGEAIDLQRDFYIAEMPAFIRQAIETKVRHQILGIQYIKKNNKVTFIQISKLIDFLEEYGKKYFDFPISIKHLGYINTWTNYFIHTGIIPYLWQSLEAIEILEPLFSIEKQDGRLNLDGFDYRKPDFNTNRLKEGLEDHFKKKYTFHIK